MYTHIPFPKPNEYPSYADMYMKLVIKDGSLLKQLDNKLQDSLTLIRSLSEEELAYKYEASKWSLKNVIVHIIDDERIYAYRALRFARNDNTKLSGFDQDHFATYADSRDRSIENIISEYVTVRKSTISMFSGFSDSSLLRKGMADGKIVSVRALGYHILGHEAHHMNIIKRLYLKNQ